MARETFCKKVIDLETQTVAFNFASDEFDNVTLNLSDFEPIHAQLALHGLSQKVGDSYAAAKGTPASDRHESFLAMVERLKSGDWVAEGKSAGPRPSMVAMAVMAFLADNGVVVNPATLPKKATDEEREAAQTAWDAKHADVIEKVKGEGREKALANAAIKAQYERLRAEAAAARAAKATEAAGEVENADGDALAEFA